MPPKKEHKEKRVFKVTLHGKQDFEPWVAAVKVGIYRKGWEDFFRPPPAPEAGDEAPPERRPEEESDGPQSLVIATVATFDESGKVSEERRKCFSALYDSIGLLLWWLAAGIALGDVYALWCKICNHFIRCTPSGRIDANSNFNDLSMGAHLAHDDFDHFVQKLKQSASLLWCIGEKVSDSRKLAQLLKALPSNHDSTKAAVAATHNITFEDACCQDIVRRRCSNQEDGQAVTPPAAGAHPPSHQLRVSACPRALP